MRPDTVFAGVYDPLRRLDPDGVSERLHAGLARFGAVLVERAGALTIGLAVPAGAPEPDLSTPDGLCAVDGYLEETARPAPDVMAERWHAGGAPALANLTGAFAAVVWDGGRERGCLVRDHLGQRPLFILDADPVLFFSSEVRPLVALPDRRPAPDPVAIARYLSPSELREELVPHTGVRRVPGAHVVRLENGRWKLERYWAPRYAEPMGGSPQEHAEATRRQIAEAVRRTVGSAQDVGVLLSGGLDSTTVAAVAASELRKRGGRLRAYSQTFPDFPTADESEQITAVADYVGLGLTRMDVHSGSSLASSLEYLDLYDLPEFSATGFFWRALARRTVADGTEVVLSGEGGDEVFGAPLFLIADRVRHGRLAAALRLVERFPNIAYNPWRSLRMRLLWQYGILPSVPPAVQGSFAKRKDRRDRRGYMSEEGLALLDGPFDPRPWRRLDGPAWWAAKADHFVRRIWELGAPEQTTRAARLAGITERHPLLTVNLLEHALRLPPEGGFDPERTRPDLRNAMEGLVPDSVRLRPDKVDFDGIRGYSLLADMPIIRELLTDPGARIRPYIRPQVVDGILDTRPERWGVLSAWGGQVMRLITTECWLRQQEDRDFARTILDSGRLAAPVLTVTNA